MTEVVRAATMDHTPTNERVEPALDVRWTRAASEGQSMRGSFHHAGEAYTSRDLEYKQNEKGKVHQCNWRPVRYDIYDYYDVGHVLGEGSTGVVKFATDKATRREWAVKMIDLNSAESNSEFAVDSIRREIEIMKMVDHPSCVQLYEVIEQNWRRTHIMFLTLELLNGGDLFERINIAPLTERDIACLARDVLKGLQYLHSQNIVHRDVKPENLLFVSADPDSDNYRTVKISDFGLAAVLDPAEPLRDMCGTPGYVAPEVVNPRLTGDVEYKGALMKAGYSTPVDIWSAGVLIYECLCGVGPFQADDIGQMLQNTIRGEYHFDAQIWNFVSSGAKDLISKMLVLDPYSRTSAEQCLEHDWVVKAESHAETELTESSDVMLDKRDSRTESTWALPLQSRSSPHSPGIQAVFSSDDMRPLWESPLYEDPIDVSRPVLLADDISEDIARSGLHETPKRERRKEVQEGRVGDGWRG